MWQDIWRNKGKNVNGADFDIANLMQLDGFDTSGESLSKQSWVEYFECVAKMAQINSGKKSILEIGCGGGQH